MGGPSDIFGSQILAQSDFGGFMKDAGIFWVAKNVLRDFLGMLKSSDFF